MTEVLSDLSQDRERVKKNVGTVAKQDISRKIVGRERNLRKTLQRKQNLAVTNSGMIDQVLSISNHLKHQ